MTKIAACGKVATEETVRGQDDLAGSDDQEQTITVWFNQRQGVSQGKMDGGDMLLSRVSSRIK
ncbi:hypothetical protein [Herbaspirillum camelliae]|uniref:hypothetical protein n=1 Tax=Herbaspirillum camelliae TaxID=1892903 RepID=UPI000B1B42D6|nr:hypothetical protein [Herbaspirillum camelliae]